MERVLKLMVQDNEGRRLEELCRRPEQLEKLRPSGTVCGLRHKPQQVQVDCDHKIGMENGLHPTILSHAEYDRKDLARGMIAVAEKYAIEVNIPVPITSERQHQE